MSSLEDELAAPRALGADRAFQNEWPMVKGDNKVALAGFIKDRTDITVDPASLFDIQVKRLHEYKRQHLNVLYLITMYNRLKQCRGHQRHATDGDVWRQGRAGLPHGQADHQA